MEHPRVRDNRSGKVLFVSHCCLNQNAKLRGIAKYPGAIQPLVELLPSPPARTCCTLL